MNEYLPPVGSALFLAMQNVDIDLLNTFSEADIRPVLPCLVRMALCLPLDSSQEWTSSKSEILKILSGISIVNDIVTLLSIDFNVLEQDVKREQQLRQKQGHGMSSLVSKQDADCGVQSFEKGDTNLKIRMLLREILIVQSEIQENKNNKVHSDIFDVKVFLEEISDILCIVHAELPNLLKIEDLAEVLLCFQYGSPLICRLVANNPESFQAVVQTLVMRGEKLMEDTVLGRSRTEAVRALCAMNPREALNVRQLCVEKGTMPGLAVALSLQIAESHQEGGEGSDGDGDIVAFISSLLLGTDQASRTWFANFIKSSQKHHHRSAECLLERLRLYLLEQLYLLIPSSGGAMLERSVVRASTLIRMYCAMKGMATFKYSDEEMKCLLNLATSRPPPTKSGAHFISLALCMLITSPNLLATPDQELQVIEWIRWLMTSESSFEKHADKTTSFGEMLFLIALHFHNNQMHAIADLVCNTLGMKSAVKANALSRMRQIFTQELFTEQVIASHAVKIPVTPLLNSGMSGYLPIHSINQLLKSRVFSKHKVPIKDWIYQQICQSGVPLHPLMPQLIESYVSSIVVKGAKIDYTNEPVTEHEVLDVYKDSAILSRRLQPGGTDSMLRCYRSKNLSPQLLILYYVLLYEDTLLNNVRARALNNLKVKPYSEVVLSQIPINFLIQEAQKEQQLYPGLFAPLLRLLATHFPHLCQVEDWLEESLLATKTTSSSQATLSTTQAGTVSPQILQDALSKVATCPAGVVQHLECLLALEVLELLPYRATVVESLTQLLEDGIPRRVLDLVRRLWFRLHSVSPRLLRLDTVNALRGSVAVPYTEQNIVVDPLTVLRCDRRVFRCPPLLEITLRILAAYTQASRVFLSNHLAAQQLSIAESSESLADQKAMEQQQDQLRNALVYTQESTILQILLECCLPFPEDCEDGSSSSSNLREVRCLIFSYVHQAFSADTNLAKLVHFQGYPSELLPLVVAGVPSMHICLDYVPELLGQPETEKQVFGIQLLAELSLWYALPKALSQVQLSLNVMFTMLNVYDNKVRLEFLRETLPCLVKFCRAFPPMCRDAVALLEQTGRICHAHLASASNISPADLMPSASRVPGEEVWCKKKASRVEICTPHHELYKLVLATFSQLTAQSTLTRSLF